MGAGSGEETAAAGQGVKQQQENEEGPSAHKEGELEKRGRGKKAGIEVVECVGGEETS